VTSARNFRVWCLSWEEDEEHGADVVGYDILSHDYDKRERGVVYVPNSAIFDAGDASQAIRALEERRHVRKLVKQSQRDTRVTTKELPASTVSVPATDPDFAQN